MKYPQNLTIRRLKEACEKHKYLLLQEDNGVYAVNCKIAPIALKRKKYKDRDRTNVIGFHPCSFQEYITRKVALFF